MKAADRPPAGYTKLHLEVYNKNVDLLPLLARFDKVKTGVISQQDFLNAMRASGLQMTDKESYDVLRVAEMDAKGDVYYRQLLRKMERTQPDVSNTENPLMAGSSDVTSQRRKHQGEVARGVMTFYKANSYTGFNRYLVNGLFSETSFMEFVSQNTMVIPADARDLWNVMPSMLSPQVLIKWASSIAAQQGVREIAPMKAQSAPPPPPAVLSRLRNIVQSNGEDYVKTALCTFTYLRLPDLQDILTQLDACPSFKEFEEFRLWCVNEGVIHIFNTELAFEGGRFLQFITGFAGDGRPVLGDKSQLGNVVELALMDILRAQMANLKQVLISENGSDSISEKHIRKTLKSTTPSLTHQNVSLLLNSLLLIDPPIRGRPFRIYSATELVALLSDWQSVQLAGIPPFPTAALPQVSVAKENIAPASPAQTPSSPISQTQPVVIPRKEGGKVGEAALLGRRDVDWEVSLFRKLKESLTAAAGSFTIRPLLEVFQKVDGEGKKVMHLDRFHWTLKMGLTFLTDSEIYHLVQIALEVSSSLDDRKTTETRLNLPEYLEISHTISRALYPDGSQYMISYTFFLMNLEARIRLATEGHLSA